MANDLWRTPPWLYKWLNTIYGPFDVDLAARADNALHQNYYDIGSNALTQSWSAQFKNGFCNPPYSNLPPWLQKATNENTRGFKSTWIIPTWNGDKYYRHTVFEQSAAIIVQIYGRISFLDVFGKPISGNRQGSIIVHYDGKQYDRARIIHTDRDEIIRAFA